MKAVYGDKCVSKTTVKKWAWLFWERHELTNDFSWLCLPHIVAAEEAIIKSDAAILVDWFQSLHLLVGEFAAFCRRSPTHSASFSDVQVNSDRLLSVYLWTLNILYCWNHLAIKHPIPQESLGSQISCTTEITWQSNILYWWNHFINQTSYVIGIPWQSNILYHRNPLAIRHPIPQESLGNQTSCTTGIPWQSDIL